ncbi:Uncharacterised protein [Achromobacter sp. 2789STDY5608628]|nr:Uncharacterised protein [Achromobacter sp. 2789STDY5608628]
MQALVAAPQAHRIEFFLVAPGHAHCHQPAFMGQRQGTAGDAVDDEIHSSSRCESGYLLDKVAGGIVDACRHAKGVQPRQPRIVRCRGIHRRASVMRQLDGGQSERAGARMNQYGFTGSQAACRKEAFMRGSPGDGDRGGGWRIQRRGDQPGVGRWRGHALRMRSPGQYRDDAVAGFSVAHLRSHGLDGAGALISHDVGNPRQRADFSIDEVAAFHRYRLDADQHLIGPADRFVNGFIAEHVGGAVFVIHRRFHDESPCPDGYCAEMGTIEPMRHPAGVRTATS